MEDVEPYKPEAIDENEAKAETKRSKYYEELQHLKPFRKRYFS